MEVGFISNVSLINFCRSFLHVLLYNQVFEIRYVYFKETVFLLKIIFTMYITVATQRGLRVILASLLWIGAMYLFWKLGDPFPILSARQGVHKIYVQ